MQYLKKQDRESIDMGKCPTFQIVPINLNVLLLRGILYTCYLVALPHPFFFFTLPPHFPLFR